MIIKSTKVNNHFTHTHSHYVIEQVRWLLSGGCQTVCYKKNNIKIVVALAIGRCSFQNPVRYIILVQTPPSEPLHPHLSCPPLHPRMASADLGSMGSLVRTKVDLPLFPWSLPVMR